MTKTNASQAHPNYLVIAALLLGLTFLTFFLSEQFHQKGLTVVFVMSIALVKATLVAMFFMHARFEGKWLCVLTVPAICLAIVLVLALLPDVSFFR